MCTHNARGTDLQSFSETGREWIFPNCGGSGGPPPRKISKKRSQMVASDGICGKDIDL